jgi:hypothetical protein
MHLSHEAREWPKPTSKGEKGTRRCAATALEHRSGSLMAAAEDGEQGAQESPRGSGSADEP